MIPGALSRESACRQPMNITDCALDYGDVTRLRGDGFQKRDSYSQQPLVLHSAVVICSPPQRVHR